MIRVLTFVSALALATGSADAAISVNAVTSNGLHLNAISVNAISVNAVTSNAVGVNAVGVNSLSVNAVGRDGSAPIGPALDELNGVAVEAVALPEHPTR